MLAEVHFSIDRCLNHFGSMTLGISSKARAQREMASLPIKPRIIALKKLESRTLNRNQSKSRRSIELLYNKSCNIEKIHSSCVRTSYSYMHLTYRIFVKIKPNTKSTATIWLWPVMLYLLIYSF